MYIGNSFLKEVVIGGGYYTDSHKKSGGWRIDFVRQDGLSRCLFDIEKYILDADNGDGTRYAVYQVFNHDNTPTDYYRFAVHIRNAKKGTFKRGDKMFDLVDGKFFHMHVKKGGYKSTVTNYLKFLDHIDPAINIRTNYSPDIYHGVNKGVEIPGTLPIKPPQADRKMQSHKVSFELVTSNTVEMNLRKEPNTKSESLGKVPPKTSCRASEIVLDSELVSGVSTWYRIEFKGNVGYISGAFVGEIKQVTFDEEKKKYEDKIKELESNITSLSQEITRLSELIEPLQGQIVTLQAENVTLTTKVDNQAQELTKFYDFKKSVFYALFLIFNRKR